MIEEIGMNEKAKFADGFLLKISRDFPENQQHFCLNNKLKS